MPATREDRSEEGVALVLGAMAIMAMNAQHGFEGFMTGVREGTRPLSGAAGSLALSPAVTALTERLIRRYFLEAE